MQAWEAFLKEQEKELGAATVQKWLRSLKIQRFDACNLYLEAKDSFQALWFEEHIRNKVLLKLVNSNNKKIKVHLTVSHQPVAAAHPQKSSLKQKTAFTSPSFKLLFDAWDPLATFSHFVWGSENELLKKLFNEMIESSHPGTPPPVLFNPIYLHGPSGSGKTHLLMSLAADFKSKGFKTIYVRAETFTDHVVSAIRAGEMSQFRQAYRNVDILLVDDVHVFTRKGATQEEFFHTFNTLHMNGTQIILSSHAAPNELQYIEPRLISRFEWGIVLPLYPLNQEELKQLLFIKSAALQFPLPQKIIDCLLELFTNTPKVLIKALEALILRLHLGQHTNVYTLTPNAVKSLLNDLLLEQKKTALTPPKIVQATAEYYGIKTEDILGKGQNREYALPRQVAMYLCRHQLKIPYVKIGDFFERDHSTVMTSVKHIQNSLDNDVKEITAAHYAIKKKLEQSSTESFGD